MPSTKTHVRVPMGWTRAALATVFVVALAWLLNSPQSTWAQPNQSKLRQSINTRVPSPTNGPTSTATPTAGPCIGRVLLQDGLAGYNGTTDTWIYSYLPNFPQTRDGGLKIKGGELQSVLMRFDLQDKVPAGAEILEAELVLWVDAFTEARSLDVGAFRVLRPWSEGSATWNSASSTESWAQPGCNGVGQDRVDTPDGTVLLAYRSAFRGINVTDSVRYWLQHPAENYGWLLKGIGGSTAEYYFASSRYNQVAYRPVLRIDYNLCGGTPTATKTPGGPTETPTPTQAPMTATPTVPPQPTTVILEPLQDTYIDEWATDENYGKLGYMYCRANGVQKMLLQFDLALPAGAQVTSAGLVLRTGATSTPEGVTIDVAAYRLKRPWEESSATWKNALKGQPWGSPGASSSIDDYSEEILDTQTIAAVNQYYAWNVTTAVQRWVNQGEPNHGFILMGLEGQHARFAFQSSEMNDPTMRPKLQITYLVEPPTPSPSATPTASATEALPPGTIRVLVFQDLNRNGVQDATEKGLAGARIELWSGSGQLLRHEMTGATGQCIFSGVAPAVYQVVERNPWGYFSTTEDRVMVQVGEGQLLVAFGNHPGSAVALPMILSSR